MNLDEPQTLAEERYCSKERRLFFWKWEEWKCFSWFRGFGSLWASLRPNLFGAVLKNKGSKVSGPYKSNLYNDYF